MFRLHAVVLLHGGGGRHGVGSISSVSSVPSIKPLATDPLILALDTSSSLGSLALARGAEPLLARAFEADHGHSQRLLPAIGDAFEAAALRPDAVDLFAAVIGPGSFTGLRVSLASLRGLAGARPCFGAIGADVVAWAARGRAERVLAITDLFHGEVFAAVYDREGARVSAYESGAIDGVLATLAPRLGAATLAAGSATAKHRATIEGAVPGVSFLSLDEGLAPHLASLAAARATGETVVHASDLLPFYLRDPLTRGLLNSQPKSR